MTYRKLILNKNESIARITLNRPHVMNCIDGDLLAELKTAVSDVASDETIKVLVITGNGRAFCGGVDLKHMAGKPINANEFRDFLFSFRELLDSIENLPKPVIAAINGFTYAGGLELMLVCDLAIASESAQLGDKHIMYNLIAGGGATQRLPRLIGIRKAKELIYTGDWISAGEAEKIGLVNKVVPNDQFEKTVNELANKLTNRNGQALEYAKMLINKSCLTDLQTGLSLEIEVCTHHTAHSEDVAHALRTFRD